MSLLYRVGAVVAVLILLLLPAVPPEPARAFSASPTPADGLARTTTPGTAERPALGPTPGPTPPDRWTNLSPAAAPSPRDGVQLSYDSAHNETVLFGGRSPGGAALGDTWVLAGGVWTDLTSTLLIAPPARYGGAMTYDVALGATVLFGGRNGSAYLSDTWTFQNGSWHPMLVTKAPSARTSSMAYDPRTGLLILYGGVFQSALPLPGPLVTFNDTWQLRSGAWQNITSTVGPGPNGTGSLTADLGDRLFFLAGGGAPRNHAWALSRGKWHLIPAAGAPSPELLNGSVAYSSAGGFVLLFGGGPNGTPSGETWAYRAGLWSNLTGTLGLAPPARRNASLVNDPVDGVTWLFGGDPSSATAGLLNDTWAFRGVPFQLNFTAAPSVTDTGLATILSDALTEAKGSGWAYTYSFSRLPLGCASANVSLISCTPLAAGSYTLNTTVLRSDGTSLNASATLWVNLAPRLNVSAPAGGGDVDQNLSFRATVANGTPPFQFAWDFGDGANASGPTAGHAYALAGIYNVSATVTDSVGSRDTVTVPVTVNVGLSANILTNRSIADVGVPIDFRAVPNQGTSPYHYQWRFSDGTSASVVQVAHAFGAAGSYTEMLTITDATGATANASVVVTVNVALAVRASADRTAVDAGVPMNFTLSIVAGQGPFNTTWFFADGGFSFSGSASHTFALPGPAWGRITVIDGAGLVASHQVNVTIVARPGVAVAQTSGCASGLRAFFAATVSGGQAPYSYRWDFGDSDSSTLGPELNHTYRSPGNYSVVVTVTDADGASASAHINGAAARGCATVTPAAPSGGSGMLIPSWGWELLAIALAAAVLISLVFWYRRRRAPETPDPSETLKPTDTDGPAAVAPEWSEEEPAPAAPSGGR